MEIHQRTLSRKNNMKKGMEESIKVGKQYMEESVKKVELSMMKGKQWIYENFEGPWDSQPACFITDYMLGLQAFGCFVYLLFFSTTSTSESSTWYAIYFFCLALTANVGGALHHLAYVAQNSFSTPNSKKMATVLGWKVSKSTIDSMILYGWRIVLCGSIAINFSVFMCIASSQIVDPFFSWVKYFVSVAYILAGAVAWFKLHTLFLLGTFLPVVVGAVFMWIFTTGGANTWHGEHYHFEILKWSCSRLRNMPLKTSL